MHKYSAMESLYSHGSVATNFDPKANIKGTCKFIGYTSISFVETRKFIEWYPANHK